MDWDDRNRGSIAIRAVAPTQTGPGLARIGAVTMALAGLAAILAPPAGAAAIRRVQHEAWWVADETASSGLQSSTCRTPQEVRRC